MPVYGVSPAGYAVPPLATILAGIQAQILSTVDPGLDLSPATPDGQIAGIYAAYAASLWELGQVIYNAYNRQDVEGAGLDNLGDITGTPREGSTFSEVVATLALLPGVYAASTWDPTSGALTSGTLVANVETSASQQFANTTALTVVLLAGNVEVTAGSAVINFSVLQTLDAGTLLIFTSQNTVAYELSSTIIAAASAILTVPYNGTSEAATTVTPGTIALFASVTIGATPTVNDGTLTEITTPVTGWLSVNNPSIGSSPNSSQTQVGQDEETDSAYALRQEQEVPADGGCTASATAAALIELGANQVPPINLVVFVLENTTNAPLVVDEVTLPPHSFAPIIWAGGATWPLAAGQTLIANTIYENTPNGITSFGETTVGVDDPYLGEQLISYSVPTGMPLYVTAIVVPRSGVIWADLVSSIQGALVAAAVAPTPPGEDPPVGQLAPGTPVVYSQISAVIMSVPGVFDMQLLAFGFTPSPTNILPLLVGATQIATIAPSTVASNILILQSIGP